MVEEEEEEEGGEKVKSASHAGHHLPARASVRQHEIRPEIRSSEGGHSVRKIQYKNNKWMFDDN